MIPIVHIPKTGDDFYGCFDEGEEVEEGLVPSLQLRESVPIYDRREFPKRNPRGARVLRLSTN